MIHFFLQPIKLNTPGLINKTMRIYKKTEVPAKITIQAKDGELITDSAELAKYTGITAAHPNFPINIPYTQAEILHVFSGATLHTENHLGVLRCFLMQKSNIRSEIHPGLLQLTLDSFHKYVNLETYRNAFVAHAYELLWYVCYNKTATTPRDLSIETVALVLQFVHKPHIGPLIGLLTGDIRFIKVSTNKEPKLIRDYILRKFSGVILNVVEDPNLKPPTTGFFGFSGSRDQIRTYTLSHPTTGTSWFTYATSDNTGTIDK